MASAVGVLAAGCGDTTEPPPDSPRPTTVIVTPASAFLGLFGSTVQLDAEVRDQHGSLMNWDSVAWSSSDESVATVTRTGLVTALGEGVVTITARAGEAEGTSEITVEDLERAALVALYEATDGPNWANNDGWLTDLSLGDWYGVETDAAGHVVRLDLASRFDGDAGREVRQGLAGPVPAELGNLARLWTLDLSGNELTGAIPGELGDLARLGVLDLSANELTGPIPGALSRLPNLRRLHLAGNRLTGSVPEEFGTFRVLGVLDLSNNRLSGPIQPALGNLRLTALYLNDNEFAGPIPDQLGFSEDLEWLIASNNRLTGPIPPELGGIRTLRVLSLDNNNLTGAIPAALARADSLESLDLEGNSLTGPIPPELGGLPRLTQLILAHNSLTGPIPPELGDLPDLTLLNLAHNSLTGPVPAEFGNLANLVVLYLHDNSLTDPLPPELGNLASLTHLFLDNNDLEGPVPSGWGRMSRLMELGLMNNSRMHGALPDDLTVLGQLRTLVAGGTGLCAPSDADFQAWLEGVPKRRIRACAGDLPVAYLTQAVQSREFPVPLIAGEGALLRVFPTARRANDVGIPATRVRFYLNGHETHVEIVPGKSSPIPTEVTEGDLSTSVNLEIDGSLVQPGLEVVIEVDPDGTLAPELGVQTRIPAAGRLGVEVQDVPVFDLTLIPFLWNEHPDSAIVALIDGMAEDPANHEMFWGTHFLLPVGDLRVNAHEPVLTSTNNGYELLFETRAIRAMEGGTGHYRGMMTGTVTGTNGVAFRPGWSSFGHPDLSTMETGFGFNLSLQSAPCGDPERPDPTFPYRDGSIGAWGYDTRDRGGLVSPSTPDLMSPCAPRWISDYHFTNALRYRLSEGGSVGGWRTTSPTRSLLLWGGVDSEGVPFLEPVVVVDAPPALPASTGDHEISGRAANGRELFSLRFSIPEVAHGDGSSSFAFVIPVGPGWENDLDRITLSGPGGSVVLDGDVDRSVAFLRDPRTRQVRGVLRDLPDAVLTGDDVIAAVSAGRGLEVLFSRGLPGPEAWRR